MPDIGTKINLKQSEQKGESHCFLAIVQKGIGTKMYLKHREHKGENHVCFDLTGMAGAEVLQMVEKGRRMSKPTNGPIEVPDSYFNMMLACWKRVADDRPTFDSLHYFFDDYFVSTEPNYRDMDEM